MKIVNLKFKIGLLIGLFVVLVCIGSILVQRANASALSLSLDPSIIEINALPPTVATSALSIQNKGDNPVQLQILLRPFKPKLENGELQYLNSQDSFIASNIQILDNGVPVEGIALGPRQQKNLTLNVNIPQDISISARPPATSSIQSQANQASVAGEVGRDYYFSIIFLSQNTAGHTSTTSSNLLGIASNVLLSIGAKEMPDGVIEEFSAGLFYESGPVPFTLRIKNKGTHFIKPKGEIFIKNMFGQNIGNLDLVSVNVLSDSIRAIPNALWKEDFLLGFYTATLNLTLSDEGPGFTKSINFFAFPFQGLIVIVIVLISAIIIVNRVRARMKK